MYVENHFGENLYLFLAKCFSLNVLVYFTIASLDHLEDNLEMNSQIMPTFFITAEVYFYRNTM